LNAWEAAQHRLGKYLSLDKISKADGLNVTSVLELTGVRDRFLVGCEDCASHIILSAAECAASTGLLKEFALPREAENAFKSASALLEKHKTKYPELEQYIEHVSASDRLIQILEEIKEPRRAHYIFKILLTGV
jgi:hypothetical protein